MRSVVERRGDLKSLEVLGKASLFAAKSEFGFNLLRRTPRSVVEGEYASDSCYLSLNMLP